MKKVFEKIIEKQKKLFQDLNVIEVLSHVDFDSTIQNSLDNFLKAITNEAIEIVKQEAEKYEECYKDCGDCEAYEKEKHYRPKFCNVIKETWKQFLLERKNTKKFGNIKKLLCSGYSQKWRNRMDIEKTIDCLKADKEYLTDMKICDGEEMDIAIKTLEKQKTMECLLEKAVEEIENLYGRETELSEEIRDLLDCLN